MNILKKLLFIIILFNSSISFCGKILVYVIDTGIDLSHQFIKSHVNEKYWDSYDFKDLHSHGTHVAGIIISGTCEEVELRSCRYYNPKQDMQERIDDYTNCLRLAIKIQPDVINFSSGGTNSYEPELALLKKLKNTTIVTVAGNDGENLQSFKYYPASYNLPNVIVVGNLNKDGTRNKSSNYGPKDIVWEIGTDVFSTLPNNNYGVMSGTSQAAAKHTNRILKRLCRQLHKKDYNGSL